MTTNNPQAFRPEHFAALRQTIARLPEAARAALVSPGLPAGPAEDLRGQPVQRIRQVLLLGSTTTGSKALEQVTQVQGGTTSACFQVTSAGKEVHQSVSREEAQKFYDGLQ